MSITDWLLGHSFIDPRDVTGIHTWADGYGVWHARVPAGGRNQYKRARDAIMAELLQRELHVTRVSLELVETDGQTAHYRELTS